MSSTFNKKKINYLPNIKIVKYIILFTIFIILTFIIYDELIKKNRFKDLIQEISQKFNYQFKIYEVNTLLRVDKKEISIIINKYLDQSIFLIPLNEISQSIHQLKWVKNVNLSTNLKNKIKVQIYEYKPIGLFSFNNQIFYFSEEGKIIEKYNKNIKEKFIVFYGNKVLEKSKYFLKILDEIKNTELSNIKEAYYINERRWNIKLTNGIIVYLSEKNIETSLRNYIKLIDKLKESKIYSIKSIDLRNNEKAIISFK